jgi:hypothetical protein
MYTYPYNEQTKRNNNDKSDNNNIEAQHNTTQLLATKKRAHTLTAGGDEHIKFDKIYITIITVL